MITLKCSHNPKALGDVIDCIFLGHAISKIEGVRVNVQIKHAEQGILNEIISFGDVIIGKETIGSVLTFHNGTTAGRTLYHKYSSHLFYHNKYF